MYPFSTQNGTDYANLLSVYLDAVFFPNLRQLDFLQEGWRLENEKLDDPQSPLIFKGVVFNEMKGAFVSGNNLLRLLINSQRSCYSRTERLFYLVLFYVI